MNTRRWCALVAVFSALSAYQYGRWAWESMSWRAAQFAVTAPVCLVSACTALAMLWLATMDTEAKS